MTVRDEYSYIRGNKLKVACYLMRFILLMQLFYCFFFRDLGVILPSGQTTTQLF